MSNSGRVARTIQAMTQITINIVAMIVTNVLQHGLTMTGIAAAVNINIQDLETNK